ARAVRVGDPRLSSHARVKTMVKDQRLRSAIQRAQVETRPMRFAYIGKASQPGQVTRAAGTADGVGAAEVGGRGGGIGSLVRRRSLNSKGAGDESVSLWAWRVQLSERRPVHAAEKHHGGVLHSLREVDGSSRCLTDRQWIPSSAASAGHRAIPKL